MATKKDKKEYEGKINTLKSAKDFLGKIVPIWEEAGETDKIISLARFAEKWQASPDKEQKEKMKIYYGLVIRTKATINSLKKVGETTTSEENKLKNYQAQLAELEATYGKYVPVKAKKKDKPVIE